MKKHLIALINELIAWFDNFLLILIDNPITRSFALVLVLISIFFYWAAPSISNLYLTVDDYTYIGNFIEWFGVPYGLLLALVLVNVWNQFDTADRSFDREADAILALYNTFQLCKDSVVESKIKEEVIGYIEHVLKFYNEEYKDSNEHSIEGFGILNNIRLSVGSLVPRKEFDVLTSELLRLLNELIDDRGDRLSYSGQRMPRSVLVLSIFSSVLWLWPFFTLNFSNFYLKLFMVGGVALVVISIILIIVDLDDPFTGTWNVDIDSWKKLLSQIQ
jgi:hypothetical protein